jgi:hypothetical protein
MAAVDDAVVGGSASSVPVQEIQRVWDGADRNGEGWEALLYTDATLFGADISEGLGPFELLLTYSDLMHPWTVASPRLVLRARYTLTAPVEDVPLQRLTANAAWWLNLELDEQVACLLSLALGVRMKSGGRVRRFYRGQDPAGKPDHLAHRAPVLALFQPHTSVFPQLPAQHIDIRHVDFHLSLIPRMSPQAAGAVLRAARHYATALWIVDDDPEQAWLQLVTAAEVAATQHQRDDIDAAELFRRNPAGKATAVLLEAAGVPALVDQIAEAFKDSMRATGRFLAFFRDFPPPEPSVRPDNDRARLDWTPAQLRNALAQVYELRSRLLHDGRPFPHPLLQPPAGQLDVPAERPMHDAYGVGPMAWKSEDLPMYLPIFAHIVHMSLLSWWRSLSTS